MTGKQIEQKVIELIHRDPFVPFVVELTDGRLLDVPHARLAVNSDGAGFIGPDGALTGFDFAKVRAIRTEWNEVFA